MQFGQSARDLRNTNQHHVAGFHECKSALMSAAVYSGSSGP